MSKDDIEDEQMEDDVFVKAARRREKREAEEKKGITQCIVCGAKSDVVDINAYPKNSKSYYCPTHLAYAKKERKEKLAAAKQKKKVSAKKIAGAVTASLKPELDAIKEEMHNINMPQLDEWKIADEIKEIMVAVAAESFKHTMGDVKPAMDELLKKVQSIEQKLSSGSHVNATEASDPLDVPSMLYNIFNAKWCEPRYFVGNYGTVNIHEIKDIMITMARDYNVKDADGNCVGKLLWDNGHNWYMMNPNIPKNKFEEITGHAISDRAYYGTIKVLIKRATQGAAKFREWRGLDRNDTKGKKGNNWRSNFHQVSVKQRVHDKIQQVSKSN
jgi:hypothetical protein